MADPDWLASAKLVQEGDPERFRAAMAGPVAARAVLFPLYAFNVEVARAPWVTQESMIAEMRLQWWRDALEEMAEGREVRRHEVTTPLAARLTADQAKLLDESVAARRWDIYRDAFDDEAHFEAYLDQTSGHLMWTGVQLLGGGDEDTVRALARAAGLANFLRAIPVLEAHNRVPLLDGRPEAVAELAQSGLASLKDFAKSKIAADAYPALVPAFLARGVLARAAKSPQAVSDGALLPSAPKQSWALWKARYASF